MCTLTWWNHAEEGYDVFFNRDERKTRLAALPPSVHHAGHGLSYVAATDANAGGTWLLANAAGLTLAILNYYEKEVSEESPGRFRSRGLLMTDLAACSTLEEVDRALQELDLAVYRAFTLMAFSADPQFRAWYWQYDGLAMEGPDSNPQIPVCSSSFLTEEVVLERQSLLKEMLAASSAGGSEVLNAYHHDDNDGHPTAHTVKMNREEAQTWSISHISVGKDSIQFAYESLPSDHIGESEFANATLPRGKANSE
ncbi:MAG: NRDE family protein [Verrucomicrobiota bacterium]